MGTVIWMVEYETSGSLAHVASTPEKAWAFAQIHAHTDDSGHYLKIRAVEMDTNLDTEHSDWMAAADLDKMEKWCGDCCGELLRGDMVEMPVDSVDTDWFCPECAPKQPKVETDAFDRLAESWAGERCGCGCRDIVVVRHMSKVYAACAGPGCEGDMLAHKSIAELESRPT